MAQGLHDSIAQSLSFLNLQVQLLESGLQTDDKELVDTTVAQIKAGVQESYEDVRELLLNFRERVHTESFSEAINTVIDRFESQTKLPVKLTVTGPEVELTDRQKIQVIFIMQEALANVRKHSKATQVLINIEYGAEFKLSVVDNGIGINQDILKKRSKRHVGLNIMGERAQRIGAKVTVQNVSQDLFESGTCVQLVISETAVEDRSSRRSSAAASSED
jgi:two-component system nitrate/nitrite sensor histidine kinase NarX